MTHEHKLISIFKITEGPISERVVRWCPVCGAIVIDVDSDGRTQPGAGMPMRFPEWSKDKVREAQAGGS